MKIEILPIKRLRERKNIRSKKLMLLTFLLIGINQFLHAQLNQVFSTSGAGNQVGVSVSSNGTIYVAGPNRISYYSNLGSPISYYSSPGTGNGQFNTLSGIAIDGSDNIYLADQGNKRIQVFKMISGSLTYQRQFSTSAAAIMVGICLDNSGNIYIADKGPAGTIKKYSNSGTLLGSFGVIHSGGDTNSGTLVIGSVSGNLYYSDEGGPYLQVYTTNGTLISTKSSVNLAGVTPDNFAIDASENFYIAAANGSTVSIFNSSYNYIASKAMSGLIGGMCFDKNGNLIITGYSNAFFAAYAPVQVLKTNPANTGTYSINVGNPVSLCGGSFKTTITISNSGPKLLNLNGNPIIQLSGTNASDYTLDLSNTASAIAGGASTTVDLTFTPKGSGARTASMTIPSDDPQGVYTLNFTGNGSALQAQNINNFNPLVTLAYGNTLDLSGVTSASGQAVSFILTGPVQLNGTTATMTGVGNATITATSPGNCQYQPASQQMQITVTKATPVIAITSSSTGVFGTTTDLTATTGSSTGAITYSVFNGTGTATLNIDKLSLVGVGDIVVRAEVAPDANYNYTYVDQNFTIMQATPVISITSSSTGVNGGTITLTSSKGGSTGAVTYSVTNGSGTATVSNGNILNLTGVGSVTVKADVAADANYIAASATQNVTINTLAPPVINITSPSTGVYGNTITLSSSTGGSTGTVTYSVVNGTGSANITGGNILNLTGVGAVTVRADIAADANYGPTFVNQNFTITQATPIINITSPGTGVYGNFITLTSSKGGSTGGVTYSVTNGTGTANVSGNILNLTGVGSVSVKAVIAADANYKTASTLQNVTITQATPVISITSSNNGVYGNTITLTSNTGGSAGTVIYSVTNGTGTATITGGNILNLTGVGSVTVKADIAANANYAPASVIQTVTIAQATPVISITSSITGVYGTSITLSSTKGGSTGTVSYSVTNGTGSATVTGGNILNLTGVGSVTVKADIAADVNYTAASTIQTVNITKTPPVISITSLNTGVYGNTITLSSNTGGSTGVVTYSVTNGTGSATITGGNILNLTGAGFVTVKADITADANYGPASVMQTVTITQATPVISITSLNTGVYGSTFSPTMNKGGSTGSISISVTNGTGTATVVTNNVTLTGAGSISITGTVAADANYIGGSVSQNFIITQKPLTITGVTAVTKVYDGTTTAILTGGTVTGVVSPDVITFATGTGAFASPGIGSKTVVATGYTIGGIAAANYSLPAQPIVPNGTISAKAITITGLSVADKVYDGSTTAALSGTPAITGVVGTEDVTLNTAGVTSNFSDPNAGTNKSVALTGFTLGGTQAGNYTLNLASSVTASITKKALTITGVTASNKIYDGTTTAILSGGTATGTIPGETVGFNPGTGAFADKNAGVSKTVTAAGYTIYGTYASNYTLSAQPIVTNADIAVKPLTITGVTATSKVYNGNTTAVLSGGTVTGAVDPINFTPGTGTFANANIGLKAVTASGYTIGGTAVANYSLTAQPVVPNATISAKAITITGLSVADKVYDGNTTAVLSGVPGITGVIASENVTLNTAGVTSNFSDQNAGTNKSVVLTGLTLGGTQAGNYTLNLASSVTASITKKALTIMGVTASNKIYDGTAIAILSGGTVTGTIPSETVGFNPGTGTFADKNAGVSKTVTAAGYTLSGVPAVVANYSLAAQPIVANATISKADQTITFGQLGSVVADSPFNLTATSTSGLIVTFGRPVPSVATITGTTVNLIGAGSTNITASQIGDGNYNPATNVTWPLVVTDSRVIGLTGALVFGDNIVGLDHPSKNFTITNTGTGTLTITAITVPAGFVVDKPSGTIAAGQNMTVSLTFTPTIVQVYDGIITITSDATSGTNTLAFTAKGVLVTGIEKQNAEGVEVYPNPSRGIFTVRLNEGDGKGIVVGLNGVSNNVNLELLEKNLYKLDLTDKADGIYILRCKSGNATVSIKLVKAQ